MTKQNTKLPNLDLKIIFPALLICAGALARLLPHPTNFTPIAAIAIFGGARLPKKYSLIIPILTLFISDIFIGFYSVKIMMAVYISFTISALLGRLIAKELNVAKIIWLTSASSLIFFFLTNAAVWAFSPLYPKSLSGLGWCYWYALPFFRNELASTIIYATIFFVAEKIINIIIRKEVKYYAR